MKNKSTLNRIVSALLMIAVIFSTVILTYAATTTEEGVVAEWITSSDSFGEYDEMRLTLAVTNNYNTEKTFTYSVELPEGVKFTTGEPVSGAFSVGVHEEFRMTWFRKAVTVVEDTQNGNTGNDQTPDSSDDATGTEEEPGDGVNVVNIILWSLLGAAVIAGVVFVFIKHRKVTAMIAIILCAGILIPMMAPLEVNAADENKTVVAIKNITVAGKEVTLKATLTYEDYVAKYTVAEDGVRVYEADHGRAMFEAEEQILPGQERVVVKDHANASAGKVAHMAKAAEDNDGDGQPDYADYSKTLAAQMSFRIHADTTGTYAIWARMYAATEHISMIVSVYGGEYRYTRMVETALAEGEFEWGRVLTVDCEAGDVIDIRIRSRHLGGQIDKFIITDNIAYLPSGMGTLPGQLHWDKVTEFNTEEFADPRIYPTANQHPRVMFTEADIPGILESMEHEDNEAAKIAFDKKRGSDFNGVLPDVKDGSNYSESYLQIIEAKAFDYAIYKNSDNEWKKRTALTHGDEAVEAMINFLQTVTFSGTDFDYRYIGSTLFTAAEVYDWCYDLLDDHEKDLLVAGSQIQASMIEAGFPPTTILNLANNGHDAEYQIQQCWLAFAIAVADDYPSIYDYIAGMYFELFIDTRNVWYKSLAYHQGSAYGTYRFDADLWGQWLIYQMTGGKNDLDGDGKADGIRVFVDEASQVIYQWIYTRRADGKIMTEGDDYEMTQTKDDTWFDSLKSIVFSAANFYRDPLLYQELLRENPGVQPGQATQIFSPVMALILNDPSILDNATGNTEVGNLPWSRYLPTPYGGMIARTGWEWGKTSNDIVVSMQMTQRDIGGHQHQDTGNFQIYYKGLLTGDSGYYVRMGEDHDTNYYGLSVAHNTLSISSIANPTGIQIKDRVSVGDLLNPDPNSKYLRSKIVGQEFGPNIYTPDYTYIAGDIAGAYDDNTLEAVRSMLFLNLELDGNTKYPGAFIVFDQIKTAEAGSTKSFLLHSQTRPVVNGNTIIIENTEEGYNGKLVDQILYVGTADAADPIYKIKRLGGEDREFWYDGKNHPNNSTMADDMAYEPGWGRLEITTTTTNTNQTDYMLNVMYVSDADGSTEVVPATLIKGNGVMGAQLLNHVAMFNMDGNNRISSTVSFTIPASAGHSTFKVNVAGMKAGTWTVSAGGKTVDCVASEDGGMLYFDAPAGKVTITCKNDNSNKTFDTVDHREPVNDILLYNVNGNYVITEVKPVKSGDTVLVPVLETFEIFDSVITREGAVVSIEYMGLQHIVIDTANKTATVNDKKVDVSALQVVGDDILVPVEVMGLLITKDYGEAEWDARAKCAYVTAKVPAYIPEEKRDFDNAIQVQNVYLTDEKKTGADVSDSSGLINTLDNSTTSYTAIAGYSGEKGAVYDLGRVYTVETIHMVFGHSKTRIYTFEILVSLDGVNYTALSGGNRFKSEKTKELHTWQEYKMPEDLQARYVKLVGYGNVPDNNWFNWEEIVFVGVSTQAAEVINSNGTTVYATVGGDQLSTLAKGAKVDVVRTQVIDNASWAKIAWNDGYAWVRLAHIAIYSDAEARIRDTGRVVANTTVKNSPWTDAAVLGQMSAGTAIKIVKTQMVNGVTYALVDFNGYQGWINMTDVALTADPDEFSVESGTVSAQNGTKVYNRSSLTSAVMGTLPFGAAVEIVQTKDIYGVVYGRIIFEDLEGWINLADIALFNPNPPFYMEIEAENTTLHQGPDSSMYATDGNGKTTNLTKDVVTVTEDDNASGGKVAKLDWGGRFATGTIYEGTDLTVNPAHLSFSVKAEKSGTHFVWVRYKCSSATPTINSYTDGNVFINGMTTAKTGWLYDLMGDAEDYNSTKVEGGYVWYRLAVCEWQQGQTYTVRLRGRDGGISYDKFVVTTDPGFAPAMEDELATIKPDRTVEAIEVTTDPLRSDIVLSETEKGVLQVKLERQHFYDNLYLYTGGASPAIGFRLTADKAGTYYVWGKFNKFNTLYASVSGYGNDFTYKYYKPDQKMEATVEGWYLIGTYDVTEAGESVYVRLNGRNGTNIIEQFHVTTDSNFVGVPRCQHSFSTDWSKDADYHWHAATCPHDDLISDKAEHIYDDDMDATCNTCGHVRAVHPHTYSTEWTSNERYHWHAATCGCTNKVSEKAYHSYGADKRCTVCGAEQEFVSDNEMTFIEAEDVNLFLEKDTTFGHSSAPVMIADNAFASGGKVAQWSWTDNLIYGVSMGENASNLTAYPAHISFDVKALKTGLHYVWARVCVDKDTNIWSYIDGNTYKGQRLSATGTGWEYDLWGTDDYCSANEEDFIWVRIGVCEWTAGKTYSVRFRARNGRRIVFDQFVVTMDNTYAPNQDDPMASFAPDTVIEAEDTTLDYTRVNVEESATASNEKHVNFNAFVGTSTAFLSAQGAPAHLSFQINAATPGKYYVWAKFDSAGTLYKSISGSVKDHTYSYYELDKKYTPQYAGWYLVGAYETGGANETIYVRLIGRNGSTMIDQLYVTADSSFAGIKPHEHAYSTDWSTDADYHWHASTCGHTELIADKGEHVYDNDTDATCNTCGYTRVVHIHTYSSEWSHDDTYHWHASTCGCTNKVSDKAEHTFGANKLCTTCGAPLVYVGTSGLTVIEAEDVDLFTGKDSTCNGNVSHVIVVEDNAGALNNKVAMMSTGVAGSIAGKTEADGYPAHIKFQVKASEAGTYYIWARVSMQYHSSLSIWSYIDGITHTGAYTANPGTGWRYDKWDEDDVTCATTTDFVWVRIAVCKWTEADAMYTVRLRSRQGGEIYFDRFVVTSDASYAPNLGDSIASFDTDTIIEAENTSIDKNRVDVTNGVVYMERYYKDDNYADFRNVTGAFGAINFQVQATAPGKYYIWAKMTSQSSMYYSFNGSNYAGVWPSGTGWQKIGEYTVTEAGEVILVRLVARHQNNRIDQFYVTSDSTWNGQ